METLWAIEINEYDLETSKWGRDRFFGSQHNFRWCPRFVAKALSSPNLVSVLKLEKDKYPVWPTLAFSWSKIFPIVLIRLLIHSRDSSSLEHSNLKIQSCIICSINIWSLKSSPIKRMLPRIRRLFLISFSWRSSMATPRWSTLKKNIHHYQTSLHEQENKKIIFQSGRTFYMVWYFPHGCMSFSRVDIITKMVLK